MRMRELAAAAFAEEGQIIHIKKALSLVEAKRNDHIHGQVCDLPPEIQQDIQTRYEVGERGDSLTETINEWLMSAGVGKIGLHFKYKSLASQFTVFRVEQPWPTDIIAEFGKVDFGCVNGTFSFINTTRIEEFHFRVNVSLDFDKDRESIMKGRKFIGYKEMAPEKDRRLIQAIHQSRV